MSRKLEHQNDCPGCKVDEFESMLLKQHTEWMDRNIRQIIREELHNNVKNDEEITTINWVLGMILVGKRRVYVVPVMAIIAFAMVIVDFYITYLKR